MARLARVTRTSSMPPVSSPTSACVRTASTTAEAGTVPVEPRSGARKIGTLAMMPALSIRSPTLTTGPVTVTSAFSCGCSGCSVSCAAAEALSAARAVKARARVRIMVLPQRIRLAVVDSIWSAAVMTLPFIS